MTLATLVSPGTIPWYKDPSSTFLGETGFTFSTDQNPLVVGTPSWTQIDINSL